MRASHASTTRPRKTIDRLVRDASGVVEVDANLVQRLVAAQFPQWAELPVQSVAPGGWDNRTFRLGEHMSARLPSARPYVAQVEKEHRWLPRLAPFLPLPIPDSLALGAPGNGYRATGPYTVG